MNISTFLTFLLIFWTQNKHCFCAPTSRGFSLRIIHTNDIHSRFEQTARDSSICQSQSAASGNCYGGFARLATLIREFRSDTSVPTLYLDAGDVFEGSTLFTFFKSEVASKFINILKPDAMALGNHEFDDGPSGLLPYLKNVSFPILAANLDLSQEPELQPYVQKSIVLTVAGEKIGIIGYLTPDTAATAQAGKVIFRDEVTALREEVSKLQGQGVKILIALGHSGYPADLKIAAEVEGLDLVVGGHTHSFLGADRGPDVEVAKGPYPTVVSQQATGRKVYVVQAYAYTKYLGKFQVDFDASGEVVRFDGSPVLLDNSVQQADDVLEELGHWRTRIEEVLGEPVGYSRVNLDGDFGSCRRGECNLGNLIVDAMVDHNLRHSSPNTDGWTDAPIALFNSGNIRASIQKVEQPLTMDDILTVLPYKNQLVKVAVPGEVILEALEWSVHSLKPTDIYLSGTFVQHSGIKVIYDLSKPSGEKVINVEVRCGSCAIPVYEKLNKKKIYKILTIDYLRAGGDNFTMLRNHEWLNLGITVDKVLSNYVQRNSPIVPGVEDRIKFVNKNHEATCLTANEISSVLSSKVTN